MKKGLFFEVLPLVLKSLFGRGNICQVFSVLVIFIAGFIDFINHHFHHNSVMISTASQSMIIVEHKQALPYVALLVALVFFIYGVVGMQAFIIVIIIKASSQAVFF